MKWKPGASPRAQEMTGIVLWIPVVLQVHLASRTQPTHSGPVHSYKYTTICYTSMTLRNQKPRQLRCRSTFSNKMKFANVASIWTVTQINSLYMLYGNDLKGKKNQSFSFCHSFRFSLQLMYSLWNSFSVIPFKVTICFQRECTHCHQRYLFRLQLSKCTLHFLTRNMQSRTQHGVQLKVLLPFHHRIWQLPSSFLRIWTKPSVATVTIFAHKTLPNIQFISLCPQIRFCLNADYYLYFKGYKEQHGISTFFHTRGS